MCTSSHAQVSWRSVASFGGTARTNAVAFTIGNRGYVGTGYDGTYRKDFWEYNPGTDTWTQKADFAGTARQDAVGFSIGSKGYIGTGYDGAYRRDFWEYNPTTNSWTQKANFGGSARQNAVGLSTTSKGYIGTGFSGIYTRDFWEYNPGTDTWTQKSDIGGQARSFATGFSINGSIYLGTGFDGTDLSDFWQYDTANDTWTLKAFLPNGYYSAFSGVINGRGYVGSGYKTVGGVQKDLVAYDPKYDIWYPVYVNNYLRRYKASAFVLNNKMYVGLGSGTVNTYSDFWVLDPELHVTEIGTWTQKSDINSNGRSSAVGFAIAGKGYITDGGDDRLSQYNPDSNSWKFKSNVGKSSQFRFYTTGFSLGNKGYLGGGSDGATQVNDRFYEYNAATDTWVYKTNIGGGAGTSRMGAVGFGIGGKCYFGTGSFGSVSSTFWQYDTTTNVWTQIANYAGGARVYAVAFSIGSKGYVGTGYSGIENKNDFWEYNPLTNVWTRKADFEGGSRQSAVGIAMNGKGYVGLGYSSAGLQKDFWEYDPLHDIWIQRPDFGGTARKGPAGFSINNRCYVGTGNDGVAKKDFWEYNPDTLTPPLYKANVPGGGRAYAVCFTINGKGYVGTGFDGANARKDFWEYNPSSDSWTQKADFGGKARYGAAGFSINDKGYIGTGLDSGFMYTKDFWEYNPDSNKWTQKADFGGGLRFMGAGFCVGNMGYVGVGISDVNVQKDLWQYNPLTDTWVKKANFPGTARYAVAAFGIGSKGYLGTGRDGNGVKNDFYEYNPLNNTWTQKANFAGASRDGAIAFANAGYGYVGSGSAGSGYCLDFWEYNPYNNIWGFKYNCTTGRSSGIGFGIGFIQYAGTGFVGNVYKNDIWEYDPRIIHLNGMAKKPLFCAGDTVYIYYDIVSQNPISVSFQLSDKNGSFVNPLTLITKTANPGYDTVGVPLPVVISSGTLYRMRIICLKDTSNVSDTFSVNYPTISISASGPVGFCDGGKVTLTGNPSSGLKYQWRINGVDSLNKSDTLASIVAKTTGNYSLKVTNSNGCRGYSNSILVSSYPIPRADFTINDSVQCLKGNNFIFRDSSTEQPSFFLWSFGNQIFSNFKIPEDMQYNAPGTYQVYLAVTTSKGCKDTVYKTVVVFNNPSASFLISSATTQCVKANEFTVQNTSTGVLTYSWDFGNGNTSTLKDPSTTYSTSGSYTIMLAVSDSNTCTDTANKTVTVLPGPPPPVITALPDTIVCKGSPVNLAATTAFWPVWYINGSPLGKTGKNITVSTTGRYVATITDGFNCSTSSNPVNVLIKPVPPQPAVTISGNVFSSNTQLGNQWYNASGPISGETGQTFIATQSGSYYTVVTVNDCSSLPSTPLSFFPVGIHSAGGKGYDVYPNPGPGLFTIKLPVSGYTLVKLFDLTGRMVMQSSSVVEDKFIVDAGKIANGTYLMVIQTESDLFRTKVIINR